MRRIQLNTVAVLSVLFVNAVSLRAEMVIDYDFTAAEGWSDTWDAADYAANDGDPMTGTGAVGTVVGQMPDNQLILGQGLYDPNQTGMAQNPDFTWLVDTTAAGAASNTGTATVQNSWIGFSSTAPVTNLAIGDRVQTTVVYKQNIGIAQNSNPALNLGFRVDAPGRMDIFERGIIDTGDSDAFGGAVDMYTRSQYNIGDEGTEGVWKWFTSPNVGQQDINPFFGTVTNLTAPAEFVGASPVDNTATDPADTEDFETDWLEMTWELEKLDPPTIDDAQWRVTVTVDNLDDADPSMTHTEDVFGDTGWNSDTWWPGIRSGNMLNEAQTGGFIKLDAWKVEVFRVGEGGTDTEPDGDVDGQDFLELQRSNPSLIANWSTDYAGPLVAASSVPEPAGLSIVVGALVLGAFRRTRNEP